MPDRRLAAIAVVGRPAGTFDALIGQRAGGELRDALAVHLSEDRVGTTLLNRLLEDLGGGVFMAAGAWMAWLPEAGADSNANVEAAAERDERLGRNAEGLCLSFSPGSPSLRADGSANEAIADHPIVRVPFDELDPIAWHEFAPVVGPSQWRIRYSDLRADDGGLHLVAGFQDSAALPDRLNERYAFHEYRLSASIAPDLTMKDISVETGVLPYRTCRAAPSTAQQLVGRDVTSFREAVPAILSGTSGCTHLNEQLRVMPDVAGLAKMLSSLEAGRSRD